MLCHHSRSYHRQCPLLVVLPLAANGTPAVSIGATGSQPVIHLTVMPVTCRWAPTPPMSPGTDGATIQAAGRTEDPPQRGLCPGTIPRGSQFRCHRCFGPRCVSSGSHMFVFSSHTRPAHSETSTAALTTPALDRRSLRWFGISAPSTATPEDLPPSLAQHGSCRRSSTSSSLPFRTHVGAENSAVVDDLPRWWPMLGPCVPNLVPIPGVTGSADCAVRPLEGP